jgi:hypothetical protein
MQTSKHTMPVFFMLLLSACELVAISSFTKLFRVERESVGRREVDASQTQSFDII